MTTPDDTTPPSAPSAEPPVGSQFLIAGRRFVFREFGHGVRGWAEQALTLSGHEIYWRVSALEALLLDRVSALTESRAALSSRSAEDRSDTERLLVERLAGAVCAMIDRGALDARSEAGDALLDYASVTYGDERPIESVRERYLPKRAARTASPRESHE
jgi:hypothetical protein